MAFFPLYEVWRSPKKGGGGGPDHPQGVGEVSDDLRPPFVLGKFCTFPKESVRAEISAKRTLLKINI